MHQRLTGYAEHPPRENPDYRIYHFFARDPEGRSLEFQSFLHELPPPGLEPGHLCFRPDRRTKPKRGPAMNHSLTSLRLDTGRLRARFDSLAAIGATPEGGVHRPAFSPGPPGEARQWFKQQAESIGLVYSGDRAGNQSALLQCGPEGAPHLIIGSHLDSVPQGGRFDGALGVAAALELLALVRDAGLRLNCHLEAVGFCDEEGQHMALMGSRVMAGVMPPEEMQHPSKGMDEFLRVLDLAGLKYEDILSARRDPAGLAGYLELHIEQGARLPKGRPGYRGGDRLCGG